jgi:hypothetical protein
VTARAKNVPTLSEIRTWPAVVSVKVSCTAAQISPSHGYDLISRGVFPFRTLKVGSSIKVLTASILKVLAAED